MSNNSNYKLNPFDTQRSDKEQHQAVSTSPQQ